MTEAPADLRRTGIPKPRLVWPDLVKGMAILLVVTGHVLGGLMAGHYIPEGPVGRWAYDWIYLFHVPALFFVSGWLMDFRTQSRGAPKARSLLWTLVYPYFLWGLINWAVQMAASGTGIANVQMNLWTPLRMLYSVSAGPWFLLILFLFHGFYLLMPVKNRPVWLLLISFVLFVDYAWFGCVEFESMRSFELNAIFYALGAAMASRHLPAEGTAPVRWSAVAGMAFLAVVGWCRWLQPELPTFFRLPLGVIGIAGIVAFARGIESLYGTGWLIWFGRHSLAIYVLHGFAPPVARLVLTRVLGLTSPWLLLCGGVLAGVLSSACVIWCADRWHLGAALGFERKEKKKPA